MPFDNIKTRLQSTGHNYRGMADCAVRTLREEGVTAFWRGSTPRLARLIVIFTPSLPFSRLANLGSYRVVSHSPSSTKLSALYKASRHHNCNRRASCNFLFPQQWRSFGVVFLDFGKPGNLLVCCVGARIFTFLYLNIPTNVKIQTAPKPPTIHSNIPAVFHELCLISEAKATLIPAPVTTTRLFVIHLVHGQ
jgi:Mitochondrial carrier protein